jgi:hypothetical protein
VPHLVRIHRKSGIVDWNTYAIVAIIELARGKGNNPEVPNRLEEGYLRAIRELAEIGAAEIWRIEEPEAVTSTSFAPSFAPLLKNVKDAITHRHVSPSFFGFAIRYEDHAGFPIQVLDAHPVKLSFVPHAGIAHQDDDVWEKLKAAFPPIASSSAGQQFLFGFIVKPE